MGAVMPSGKLLARTMAQYVDIDSEGPVVELGPGTGAITSALIEHGVDQKRLVLVEYNPGFCALLRRDAFLALAPGAPFVQFTYSVVPPIPKSLPGVSTEASERIWMNLPPARVWVYRKG